MNNYKELIEELRSCAEKGYFAPCEMENAADAIEQLVKERDAIERDLAVFEYCPLCAHCHEHIIGTDTETNEEEDLGECGQGKGIFHQLCLDGKISRCGQYKWRGMQE